MESTEQAFHWLELIERPAFCVKDGVVAACNDAAQGRTICVGTDIHDLVTEHFDTYRDFTNGCLFLPVTICGIPCNASVNRTEDYDIFILEQDSDNDKLQALALAAQQLRGPLSDMMVISDRLRGEKASKEAAQLQKSLFQLLRITGNMSDVCYYYGSPSDGMEMANITSIFRETIEKVQALSDSTGIQLTYTEPKNVILGLANAEKLERAVYNILSNAIKFSPKGSTVDAKLSCSNTQVSFTVCNPCSDSVPDYQLWSRYRREPAIEDSRRGLGLGMTIISTVATAHGGTVLVDYPDKQSIRVRMTIALIKENNGTVRSPVLRMSDYAGGWDKALLEFAEMLPSNKYKNI